MYKLIIPIVAAVAVIVACTVIQGNLTERWQRRATGPEELAFAERLQYVPKSFGEWESEAGLVDEEQLKVARVVGHLERVYSSRRNPADRVTIYLVCGAPRFMTDHNPDNCYIGQGFLMDQRKEPERYPLKTQDGEHEFYQQLFVKEDPVTRQELRIFWAWNAGKGWEAPTEARVKLRYYPALYKMYAISVPSSDAGATESVNVRFLREFTPLLQEALFPTRSADAGRAEAKPAAKQAVAKSAS